MISAMVLSMLAATLSVLAFCLARRPLGWMKLWSPRREFLAVEYLSPPERRFLTHIRFRATLAGIALLVMAILLPAIGAASFRLPSRAWGAPRTVEAAPPERKDNTLNPTPFVERQIPLVAFFQLFRAPNRVSTWNVPVVTCPDVSAGNRPAGDH